MAGMKLTRNMPKGKLVEREVTYKCGCVITKTLRSGPDLEKYMELCTRMTCKPCWKKSEAEKKS